MADTTLPLRTSDDLVVQDNDQSVSNEVIAPEEGWKDMTEYRVWMCRNCASDSLARGPTRPVGQKCRIDDRVFDLSVDGSVLRVKARHIVWL
jgi:hypothetical protein